MPMCMDMDMAHMAHMAHMAEETAAFAWTNPSVRVPEPGTMPTVLERLTVPRVPGVSETFPFAVCSSRLM